MTIPQIASTRIFPLKGAKARSVDSLELSAKLGVLNDRWLGIKKKPENLAERREPFKKGDYYVCANTPAMAVQESDFVVGNLRERWIIPGALERFAERIGAQEPGHFQDTRGEYHLCDTNGPQVSFLNLATLRAFGEFLGMEVDPDRFRMNVWITGLPAFAEYEWVAGTREMMVGDVRMRVDDVCERCKATHANPNTGEYDLDVVPMLQRFMGSIGYKSPHSGATHVMGIYAAVSEDGIIRPGDKIRLI